MSLPDSTDSASSPSPERSAGEKVPSALAKALEFAAPAAGPERELPWAAIARSATPPVDVENIFASASGVKIQAEIKHINEWAALNDKDAQKDMWKFWALKMPAILGGIAVSFFQYFGYAWGVTLVGLISSACIAIDGFYPQGRLYNVHKRAFNDLRSLQDALFTKWAAAELRLSSATDEGALRETAAKLLEEAHKEKTKIARYIRDAEANLREKASHQKN